MSRWNSGANAANAALPAIAFVVLVELDFADQTIYLCDGFANLTFLGNTYYGVGDFGSFDVVEESTETIAKTVTLALTGVPGPLLTEAMTQDYQGRSVILSAGLVDINSLAWIDAATPEEIWAGRMDYMTVEAGQGSTSIQLRCENRLNREPLVARFTDLDQQIAHPGDTFLNLVWQIPYATAGWGQVTVQYPATVAPTGRGTTGPGGGGGPYRGNKP